jgi:hypothetical protein
MRKLFYFLCWLTMVSFVACNSGENSSAAREERTKKDSLLEEVDDGHIQGMAKMGKLTLAEQTARRMLDSIAKLPAKARNAAEPLRIKLDSLQKELSYAENAMEKWMKEFNRDSAINDAQKQIDYLANEKLKVSKVKEAILTGLQRADSVLKAKF